jgi:hypothetical protein
MSYYMGDYRGDFYSPYGDPGIGSFFKRVLGGAAHLIPGVGGVVSRAISHVGAAHPAAAAAITAAAGSAGRAIVKHPVLSVAGAAGALAGSEALMRMGGGGHPGTLGARAMHMSKPRRGVAPHLVKNRHMNFANPRALRRATRRLHAFARHYRKVVGFVTPHKPKGRIYFKKRYRKAA